MKKFPYFPVTTALTCFIWFSSPAYAENINSSWIDINLGVACNSLGINASGRISASANITRNNNGSITVHTLTITSNHAHSDGFAARIAYEDTASSDENLALVSPWYATIATQGSVLRVLPRNKTTSVSGPEEQGEIYVGGRPIHIN